MGGYGSGWPYWKGKKTTVGECRRFDIASLRRGGVLVEGSHWRGSWAWWDARTGEKTASVGCEVSTVDQQAAWVRLWYEFKEGPHKGREVDYRIPLQVTHPHYGGVRWWFSCPLQDCGRRVRILYFPRGAVYFGSSVPTFDENHLQSYNDRSTVEIKGLVDRDPDLRDKTTHLRLSARDIRVDKVWRPVSGTALLFVPRYPAYSYCDVLLVRGKLETPPQLGDFDYKDYLAHQGIYATMLYPEIEVLETGQGFPPLEWVYSLRNGLSQTLTEVLPEPQASLAQGIILGMRGNIPSLVRDNFINSGTAHLLAISGLHLSIVPVSYSAWVSGSSAGEAMLISGWH